MNSLLLCVRRTIALALVSGFLSLSCGPGPTDPPNLDLYTTGERASVSSEGHPSFGGSPSVSGDGRFVAFDSTETNLDRSVALSGLQRRVFVYDRETGQTEQVSLSIDGGDPNSGSSNPSLSSDGRYVAFESSASNLVSSESDGHNVFVFDCVDRTTTLVSINSVGEAGNRSWGPILTADSRWVVFHSRGATFVRDQEGLETGVYAHNLLTRETVLVISGGSEEQPIDSLSASADGRFITYDKVDPGLPFRQQLELSPPILVHDRDGDANGVFDETCPGCTGTIRVDFDPSDRQTFTGGVLPGMSPDGRFVAYYVAGSPCACEPDDHGTKFELAIHDRDADGNGIFDEHCQDCVATQYVREGPVGDRLFEISWYADPVPPSLSRDGRLVSFESSVYRVFPRTSFAFWDLDVLIYDRLSNATWRVGTDTAPPHLSPNMFSLMANGVVSEEPDVSADGKWVAFVSNGIVFVEPIVPPQ